MRYNDPTHLSRWREKGQFPAIHDAIFAVGTRHIPALNLPATALRFCDLCCSTGLLGQRFASAYPGSKVIGVEGLDASIAQAKAAGIAYPLHALRVTPATQRTFHDLLLGSGVTVLLARRCLSELFATDRTWGPSFWDGCVRAGVRMAVIQGRAPCANPTHPLPSIREELAALGTAYRVLELTGQCAVIAPKL